MPLTDEEREWLAKTLGTGQATPSAPGTLPPGIAEQSGLAPYVSGVTIPRTGIRINYPKPAAVAQTELEREESSAARRTLLRKAADQKLQLEQGIALFNKIFEEAKTKLPTIKNPEGTLPIQRVGRWVGKELGLREQQRGFLNSLRARATPSLKSLGEVGVLTNQDIDRILKGGFPADDDTDVSVGEKHIGLISDLQAKLDMVNATLGQSGTRRADQQVSPSDDPYVAEAIRRGLVK